MVFYVTSGFLEVGWSLCLNLSWSSPGPSAMKFFYTVMTAHFPDTWVSTKLTKLRDKYFWHKMYMDIQHYCLSCESCAMKKNPKGRITTPLYPIPVHSPWEVVASDWCGPFVQTHKGNRYLVVFTDMCTCWCEAFAVPDKEGKTIAKLLVDEIVSRHGAPRKLLTDCGSNYKSSLLKEVCSHGHTQGIHNGVPPPVRWPGRTI